MQLWKFMLWYQSTALRAHYKRCAMTNFSSLFHDHFLIHRLFQVFQKKVVGHIACTGSFPGFVAGVGLSVFQHRCNVICLHSMTDQTSCCGDDGLESVQDSRALQEGRPTASYILCIPCHYWCSWTLPCVYTSPMVPVLSNIEPPALRRKAATDKLVEKIVKHDSWPVQPDILSPPLLRLTSRKPLWLDLQPVDIKSRWRHNWKSAQVVNSHLVCDPTIRQPGFDLPRQQWSLLNRFCTVNLYLR